MADAEKIKIYGSPPAQNLPLTFLLGKVEYYNCPLLSSKVPRWCVGVGVGGSGYYCYGSQLGNSTQPAARHGAVQ